MRLKAYNAILKDNPALDKEKNSELLRKYQKTGCRDTLDKIVRGNLRLVLKVVKKFDVAYEDQAEDLVSEGNIGIMIAAEKFDFSKDASFSTYALWWIRQRMQRFLMNDRTIHIPTYVFAKKRAWDRARIELEETGISPSIEDIAGKMASGDPVKKQKLIHAHLSLEKPVGFSLSTKEGRAVLSKIYGVGEDFTLKSLYEQEKDHIIKKILSCLDEREEIVIKKRFGLLGEEFHHLGEVGKGLNLSRERVRQIECAALRKMAKNFNL